MTYRKILAHVTGGEGDAQVLRSSLALAKAFDGHVVALYVQADPAEVVRAINNDLPSRVIQELIDAARSAATEDLAAINATLRQVQDEMSCPATAVSLKVRSGREEGEVAAESLLSDLIVFEHPAELDSRTRLSTVEAALLVSGRPLLLLPRDAGVICGGRAAIGWDGSATAAHAVSAALPLLTRAQTIEAISIADDVADAERTRELHEYLKLRGLSCVDHAINSAGEEAGAVLLDAAQRAAADFLVVGGYGHSRLRELVLGGVTRHLLGDVSLPLLMAH
jgi:nucleotide-binding universal stress UspA family protein